MKKWIALIIMVLLFVGCTKVSDSLENSEYTNDAVSVEGYAKIEEFSSMYKSELISLAVDPDRKVEGELIEYCSETFLSTRHKAAKDEVLEIEPYDLISLEIYITPDTLFYMVYKISLHEQLVLVYCNFDDDNKIDSMNCRWF